MHFHFPLTTQTILWTLAFAAHLVLLVVLMGRDRIRRFPWFSLSIALSALRLLSSHLLVGRMSQVLLAEIFIPMGLVIGFVNLMVLVEVARRAFGGIARQKWTIGALSAIAAGAALLIYWGRPWPAWAMLMANPPLNVLQFITQKTMLLADIESVIVGLLIVALGARVGAGFRSHAQQIAIGLMTAAVAELSVEKIWEAIARKAVVHSMEERNHILGIGEKLMNTNKVVYLVVLIWWIVCLWRDEKGRDQAPGIGEQTDTAPEITQIEANGEPL